MLNKNNITREMMEEQADNLENYLNIVENYIIIKGITKKEKEKAVKKVRKLIKKLREGDKSVYKD